VSKILQKKKARISHYIFEAQKAAAAPAELESIALP